jgi:hypothetical protein
MEKKIRYPQVQSVPQWLNKIVFGATTNHSKIQKAHSRSRVCIKEFGCVQATNSILGVKSCSTMGASEVESKKLWKDAVLSILDGAVSAGSGDEQIKVKKLRKLVLLSLQQEDSDKAAKKQFKKVVQGLEEEDELTLDEDGMVARTKTSKKRKAKEEKDTKKKKKKKHQEETTEDDGHGAAVNEQQHTNEDASSSANDPNKNKAVKGNPQGVTRLFLGNLPFAVDEASLESFLPKSVTHIKWITDKETGKFYGSGFIEMNNSVAAADAVAMAGSSFMGRRKLLMCCGCACACARN